MAYTKQNFEDGQVLTAEHLNNMEKGIAEPSWNDLTDKPFGESPTGGDSLTWDGNTEGLVFTDGAAQYKVSDATPTVDDLQNGGTVVFAGETYTFSSDNIMDMDGFLIILAGDYTAAMIISEAGAIAAGAAGDVAGTYFYALQLDDGVVSCTALTIPGYTGFPVTKQIDSKYLPPLTQAQLPAGYPWDGRTVIEWDGNTENAEFVSADGEDVFVYASDKTPGLTELYGGTLSIPAMGGDIPLSEDMVFPGGDGWYTAADGLLAVVLAENQTAEINAFGNTYTLSFARPGIYFVALLGLAEVPMSLAYGGNVVPIAEALLPARVKTLAVTVFQQDDGTYASNATFEDVTGTILSGGDVRATYSGIFLHPLEFRLGEFMAFNSIFVSGGTLTEYMLTMSSDGSVTLTETKLT